MAIQEIVTIIVAIIGAVTGSISLGKQFWKERPRFSFEIKKAHWNPLSENYYAFHYSIVINVLLRNKGEQDTTIHRTNITFQYKGKPYSIEGVMHNEILMQAGSAKSHFFTFDIHKDEIQIDSDITNVKLIIEDTHIPKDKTISKITQAK